MLVFRRQNNCANYPNHPQLVVDRFRLNVVHRRVHAAPRQGTCWQSGLRDPRIIRRMRFDHWTCHGGFRRSFADAARHWPALTLTTLAA